MKRSLCSKYSAALHRLFRSQFLIGKYTNTHTADPLPDLDLCAVYIEKQESQLSPSDRAMRLVSSNLANYHATVQKLLIRQVLTTPMV